jgi:hypothetical protein
MIEDDGGGGGGGGDMLPVNSRATGSKTSR